MNKISLTFKIVILHILAKRRLQAYKLVSKGAKYFELQQRKHLPLSLLIITLSCKGEKLTYLPKISILVKLHKSVTTYELQRYFPNFVS